MGVTKEGDRTDKILLATVLPDVRSFHFGKEETGKGIQDSSSQGGRKKVDEEKEVKNTKDGLDKRREREMKASDLLEESSRSGGRIRVKWEDRESYLSKEAGAEEIPSDSALLFLKMAAIHHQGSPTEHEANRFDDEHSKEGSAGGFFVEGRSFDKEDFEDVSTSSLDLSEEEIGCGEGCRNRAQQGGFPEEQETSQCPKGMMLDVWGYCRWVHQNEVRDWQWWAAIRSYQMAHGHYNACH